MKNSDIYGKDIGGSFTLENQGAAKVDEALDAQQLQTLRFELETFVCKGHYDDGLRHILESYVETLRRGAESPAAWVSGFYGSGRSHLVKMLRALWRKAALKAASGTLSQGEGDSIRKAVLSLVFRAAGLPGNYDAPRALMWLRHEGIEDVVRHTLQLKGKRLERELADLSVSTALHEAILAAKPALARDSFELGDKLDNDFSSRGDIDQQDFIRYFKEAVTDSDSMPVYLLVLDELQRYIADSQDRAIRVQEIIESLTKGFGLGLPTNASHARPLKE